jgi:hypothetical protein
MSPRVQAQTIPARFRTPRIPFLLLSSDLVFEALTKRDILFDQSFFISELDKLFPLFRMIVFKIASYKKLFHQYYICFPTSVI